MEKVIIQNDTIDRVLREDVQKVAQETFEQIIKLNYFSHIAEDIAEAFIGELVNQSFMTEQLELSEKQKDVLKSATENIVNQAVNNYKGKIKTDQRTKDIVSIVESNMRNIVEKALCDIGQEINRGCIINSHAVKADAKSDKYNVIELHHSKNSGDITVPTKGIFISTNCVDMIINSVTIEPNNNN